MNDLSPALGHAIRKVTMIHRNPKVLMFFLINTAFRESGFHACISPRITTVIQIVRDHQINYNCFNEPSAVSPYKLLILRLAWLSL